MRDFSDIYESIKELYESSNLTDKELSARSGVPEANIKRFFSEPPKNPSFYNLCAVINALGGNIDEMCGFEPSERHIKHDVVYKENTPLVQELRAERQRTLKERNIFAIICSVLILLIIGILLFDLAHPELGYIRYQAQQTVAAFAGTTAVRML